MPLSRLDQDAIRVGSKSLFQYCDEHALERTLSQQDVYLDCQPELLSLDIGERHLRLAELVTYLLGDGLLKVSRVRDQLCNAAGIESPKSFRPGTPQAISLCSALNLPIVFAGALPPAKPSPVARLRQFRPVPKLMDFQQEVLQKASSSIREKRSCLISMPTGGGKTLVGTILQKQWHSQQDANSTSLWIAHTDELCAQASSCIEQVWQSPITSIETGTVVRAWGSSVNRLLKGVVYREGEANHASSSHTVVVSTPQSALKMLRDQSHGSLQNALSRLGLLIVDEAHRAGASSYRNLIAETENRFSGIQLVGLSATPVRDSYSAQVYRGTEQLTQLFEQLIEPVETLAGDGTSVQQLQERGVLSNLDVKRMANQSLDLKSRIREVAKIAADTNRTGILFSTSVSQAKLAAIYLRELGVSADYVASDSTPADRANLVEALRNGDIRVLANCEILTTGFDAPIVTDIFLFRSTQSLVLYKQMVGRGLRGPRFGGSDSCALYLCGVDLTFDPDPNTAKFARAVWSNS